MAQKLYVHPITMTTAYVDDQLFRDPQLVLSPHPDTIGSFVDHQQVDVWLKEHGLIETTLACLNMTK